MTPPDCIGIGSRVVVRADASSALCGRAGTVVDADRPRYQHVAAAKHFKVDFDDHPRPHRTNGLWFDATELDALGPEKS